MVQLVNAFEKWPKDMERVEREAVDSNLSIKRVEIFDTLFRIKRVHVHVELEDLPHQRLVLKFVVKKKQEKKLLTLAAETLSDSVSKREDFEHLEVPNELLTDLNEAYDDIWRGNMKCQNCKDKLEGTHFVQCPSNINHKFCFPCTRNYIIMQGRSSKVFCPSGGRCLLRGSTVPWSFFKMEIETILGDHPDKGQEKEDAQ